MLRALRTAALVQKRALRTAALVQKSGTHGLAGSATASREGASLMAVRTSASSSLSHGMLLSRAGVPAFGAFTFAVGCGAAKDASCDALVQTSSGSSLADIDWRRVSVFASFGACFVGAWQYMLFTVWMQRLVPMTSFVRKPLVEKLKDPHGLRGVAAYVMVENAFNQPFAHFPVLYAMKHAIEHSSADATACVQAGVERARGSFIEDNLASCAVWVPATLINALFVPPWARVPVMSAMGAGWTCFMSWRRGAPDADADSRCSGAELSNAMPSRM